MEGHTGQGQLVAAIARELEDAGVPAGNVTAATLLEALLEAVRADLLPADVLSDLLR